MTLYLARSQWNARQPRNITLLDRDEVEGIALHWPGMDKPLGQDRVAGALRGWQDDHMDNPDKLWSDIAYQVAVDQWGRAWDLRGLDVRSAANGDQDVNQRFGAVLLVIATGELPTPAMVTTVQNVIGDFRAIFPGANKIVPHSAIRPHPTDCPGDIARSMITQGKFNPPTSSKDEPMTEADRAQLTRIEKALAAFALAEANRYADIANRTQRLTEQEAGRYTDYVKRYNAIMAELVNDTASPVTKAAILAELAK